MLDFTSSLYLGLAHPSASLPPWAKLTTGRPAALGDPPGAAAVAERLAQLQGCEAAVLAPSTLHLFWDLFGMLDSRSTAVYRDAGVYPVAGWGVERAAARGVAVRSFPHHDATALALMLVREPRVPLVVADGYCPGCGRPAPLAAYLRAVRTHGGQLVIDDTQALGMLGAAPSATAPYGLGGGGTARMLGVGGPGLLLISSLAKALGAPVAALSSGAATVAGFVERSETRVYSSPPSVAAVGAAAAAIECNSTDGEALRRRLARRVERLRARLKSFAPLEGGLFPVQTLPAMPGVSAQALYQTLLRVGVRGVLRRGHGSEPCLSLIVTARHTPQQIDRAALLLRAAVATVRGGRRERRV